MTMLEAMVLAGLGGIGYWLYRSRRRGTLRRSIVSAMLTVTLIVFGVFVVYYGKLWHAWIFPVKNWQGVFREHK